MMNRLIRPLQTRQGGFTAETAILVTLGIAGLVAMGVYVQRAIQGSTFSVASSLGSQYDPRDHYREDQTVQMTEEVYRQALGFPQQPSSMVPAHHLPQPDTEFDCAHQYVFDTRPPCSTTVGGARRRRTLESLPTGLVFREPAMQFTEMTADWDSGNVSTYRDHR